jgi:hypothetical protein
VGAADVAVEPELFDTDVLLEDLLALDPQAARPSAKNATASRAMKRRYRCCKGRRCVFKVVPPGVRVMVDEAARASAA